MGQNQKKRRTKAPARKASPTAPANYHVPASSAGLSPDAQKRHERFMAEYNESLRTVRSTVLEVLVWGPGITVESPLAEKRWQIREALRKKGHSAHFSEEIEEADDLQDLFENGKGLLLKALRQAQKADFLILLLDERALGVATELQICIRSEIAAKVFIIVPASIQGTFLDEGSISLIKGGNGAIYPYTPDELAKSYVLTAAVNRVEDRRFQYVYNHTMNERG